MSFCSKFTEESKEETKEEPDIVSKDKCSHNNKEKDKDNKKDNKEKEFNYDKLDNLLDHHKPKEAKFMNCCCI